MAKSFKMNMTEGPLLPKIIKFSIPVMLSGLLQQLYNAADVIMIGNLVGSKEVAAIGSTAALSNLLVTVFVSLSVGCSILVSNAIGAKADDRTRRLVHTGISVAFIGGAIASLIGVLLARPALELMGTPADIIDAATLYLRIFLSGSFFLMVYNFGAAILQAAGDSRRPFLFLACSGLVNVVLNYFFITVLHMTVNGVAIATVVSQALSAALVLITLVKEKGVCHLDFRRLRIYRGEFCGLLATGLPAGIESALFSISNTVVQSAVNSFDSVTVAGSTASANLEGFVFQAVYAFYTCAVTVVGQNVGAGKYKRTEKVMWECFGIICVLGAVIGAVLFFLADPLLSIYLPNDPAARLAGAERLRIIAFPYILCGAMDMLVGAIRGYGKTVPPMVTVLISVVGSRLLWIFTVFQVRHDMTTLFFCYPLSWTIATAALLIMFYAVKNKREKTALSLAEPHAAELLK